MTKPDDVTQAADGFYYRDGQRLCEDCWQPIPRYVDFPLGLVSPDSDGDAGGNFIKQRPTAVEGKDGMEYLREVVCLPCYLAAYARWYPGAEPPELSAKVLGERASIPASELHPIAPEVSVGEPRA